MIWILPILAYCYVYKCGIVSDDKDSYVTGNKVKFIWIGVISYVLDSLWAKVCGKFPKRWHLVSLGYHLITVSLFYLFAKQLFGSEIALVASLLFSIHPGTAQAVAWISARHYSVLAWTVLGGFMLAGNPLFFIPIWGLGALLLPQGGMLPLVLGFHSLNWLVLAYIGGFLCLTPYYLRRLNRRLDAFKWEKEKTRFSLKRINMLIKVNVYYMFVAILPFRLGFYHRGMFGYNYKLDKFNYLSVVGAVLLLGFGAMAFVFKNTMPAFSLGIVWFFLFLIPCINIVHNNMIFAERYMYIPLFGFCMALANVLVYIPNYPIVLAIILTLYFVRTSSYVLAFRNELTLYVTNIRNHPRSAEAHVNYGDLLLRDKRPDLAHPMFERATILEPDMDVAWFNLGCAKIHLGDTKGAKLCWLKATELNPKYINPRFNLLRLEEEMKKGLNKEQKHEWDSIAIGVNG